MAAILKKANQGYIFLFNDLADQRLIKWPFISKPYQLITLVTLYLLFVLKWGPQWMKNRKPFNLDRILIVYNALQVLVCAYIFKKALDLGWGTNYKWVCEPVNFSNAPIAVDAAKLTYVYFLTKLLDLLDTVFFVLRKKNNQVSFLHLYHHTGMTLLIWGTVTYYPGGHGTFLGVMNCLVHVVMYSYYLLSVAVPEVKGILWMKRLVTQLQILQFLCGFIHTISLLIAKECGYPRWATVILLPQNLFLLILFIDFYIKTYVKKPKETTYTTCNSKETEENIICSSINTMFEHGKVNNDTAINKYYEKGIENNVNKSYFVKDQNNVYRESLNDRKTR